MELHIQLRDLTKQFRESIASLAPYVLGQPTGDEDLDQRIAELYGILAQAISVQGHYLPILNRAVEVIDIPKRKPTSKDACEVKG